MNGRAIALLATGLLAACSSGSRPDPDSPASGAGHASTAPDADAARRVPHARDPAAGFASLPDRGDLVAYDRARKVRKVGAYTLHPVSLSEAHALGATGPARELVLTTPDGRSLRLRYESHVEHKDGNWTWIGRASGDPDGIATATLTFGEQAAFGIIPNGDEPPLRLDVAAGRAWLVETDSRLAAVSTSAADRPRVGDSPLLRDTAGVPIKGGSRPASTASVAGGLELGHSSVVDVLVGYTAGLAARLGGDSQARTRVTYLVDRGNVVLRNSRVSGRLRLVHAMRVNYPDDTSNLAALHAMSGFTCREAGCSPTPIPAALQAMHTARDTYGADLVSLLRVFRGEENGSCGAAWLIGGGVVEITPEDEVAGMSVVADTSGLGTCREENLVHELAHNMGSAHDRDTADGANNILEDNEYGAHTFSFGFKGANKHTVMAYGYAGSTPWPGFSSPLVNCGTVAATMYCGVRNYADNARSLALSMSTIARFRARLPHRAVSNDFNGDGRSDLLFHNPKLGSGPNLRWWYMDGAVPTVRYYGQVDPSWTAPVTADIDGDQRVDVIWQDPNLNLPYVEVGAACGNGWCGWGDGTPIQMDMTPHWRLEGAGDLDGDGRDDLLWQFDGEGEWDWNFNTWSMSGEYYRTPASYVMLPGYRVVATGDFNGDLRLDIVWRSGTTNTYRIWLSGASGFTGIPIHGPGAGWQLSGAGDVDNDGKSDLLWRLPQQVVANFRYWRMDGATRVGQRSFTQDSDYQVVALGDYDGNGMLDVVWRYPTSSMLHMWLNVGGAMTASTIATGLNSNWVLLPGR